MLKMNIVMPICLLIFGWNIFIISNKAEAIELENPGFENTEKPATLAYVSGKTGWQCPVEKDSCKLSRDAYSGSQSIHLRKGNLWQKITDKTLLGKSLSVSFFAKGSGMLKCSLAYFVKDNEKWSRYDLKSNIGAGCPLTDQYLPYSVKFESVPANAEYIMLCFVDSSPTDWYIDDVKLFSLDIPFKFEQKKKAEADDSTLPASYFFGRGTIPEGFENIAPLAKISTSPYAMMAYRTVDGVLGTGVTFDRYPVIGAKVFDYIYDQSQKISAIRFSIPSSSFAVYADSDGKGKYDKKLKVIEDGPVFSLWGRKEWPWYKIEFEKPLKAYGIRYIDFSNKSKAIMEFQILSPTSTVINLSKNISLPDKIPLLSNFKEIPVPESTIEQRYLQGFTIEPWMYSCPSFVEKRRKGEKVLLENWKPYRKMIDDYNFFKANFMLLFPPKTCENVKGRTGTFAWDVMWPSKVWEWDSKENYLKEFCEEVKKDNISVFTVIRYRYFKKDLPYPPINKLKTYGLYGNNVAQSVAEMAGAGANGVSLCLDEDYFGAGYPVFYFQKKNIPENAAPGEKEKMIYNNNLADIRRKSFEKRWNLKLDKFPHRPEDNELYRKFVIFYYEQEAEMMKNAAERAKKANPKVKTIAAFASTDCFNNRLEKASDHDIFGFGADIDYMFCDPYFTREDPMGWYHPSFAAQVLRASSPKRQAGLTLNYNWGGMNPERNPLTFETYPDVCYLGAVLGGVMNGATAFDFWRYNFACDMDPIKGGRENVKRAYAMLDTLAAWGGKEAHLPKDIAILRSRASEDWWQLKVQFGDSWSGQRLDGARGYSYFKWIAFQLLRNGYPFETYFMDHPEAYEKISDFKTIILPFPYAMSKKAFKIIENAALKGTEIIVLGAKGEVDELGNPYPTPLLTELIANGKITYFDADIQKQAHFPELAQRFKNLLNKKLGTRRTLHLKRYGKDIQVGCLEKNPDEKFILLINWNDEDVVADIGIRMPDDKNYYIKERTPEQVNEMKLENKQIFTATDLKNFRIKLKNGEAKILYIFPDE